MYSNTIEVHIITFILIVKKIIMTIKQTFNKQIICGLCICTLLNIPMFQSQNIYDKRTYVIKLKLNNVK